MIDEIIEKRKEVLDLLLLVGVLSFLTSILSSFIAEKNIQIGLFGFSLSFQGFLLLVLPIISLIYLAKSPLSSLVEEQWITFQLGYNKAEGSLLVPISVGAGSSIISRMNRVWQEYQSLESGNNDSVDPIQGEGTEVSLRDFLEYGVILTLSQMFRSGWEVDVDRTDRRVIRRASGHPYEEIDLETLISTFPNNPLLGEDLESNDDSICFRVPQGTIIRNKSEPNSDESINIILENDYVKIHLHSIGYTMNQEFPSHQVGRLGEMIEKLQNSPPDELEDIVDAQRRNSYASVDVLATIRPKRWKLFWPDAKKHLRWAVNVVKFIKNTSDYPLDKAGPVDVEF